MTTMTQQNFWIRDAKFDLTFVMGGALLTLLTAAMVAMQPSLLPIVFWVWVIFFEGSHFWATWSRTYLDQDFKKNNRSLMYSSLIFFLIPMGFVALRTITGWSMATDIYGFFIFLWSLYHNARQHYGFVSIYNKKAALPLNEAKQNIKALYLAVVSAQIYFLFHIRLQNAFPAVPALNAWGAFASMSLTYLPILGTVTALFFIFKNLFSAVQNKKSINPALYSIVCWVFYTTMFYFIAPQEPFFSNPVNGAQSLMLIAVMNSLFHNIQYHAIVWHYGNKRVDPTQAKTEVGVATSIYKKRSIYMTVAVVAGLFFAFLVSKGGDWPSITGSYQASEFNTFAYIFVLGIIGHHFFLDQYIWRPSKQSDLSQYLGINKA